MSKSSSSPQPNTAALAVAINVEGATPPEWVELIPAGVDVIGRDGRAWINPDPAAVVAATDLAGRPLLMDWEHATETRAPQGLDAPAAAWIEQLEVREGGSIWGKPDWTPRAANQVVGREYRFLSPVFAYDPATRRITRLLSAGLTNTPNLALTALNREDGGLHREKETPLSLADRLREAYGLPATATDEEIFDAVAQAKAANKTGAPDLTSYAPRAELTAAVNRANAAEAALKAKTDADHAKAIDTAIAAAQDAGKIIPASVDDYRAMCSAEGGLERFTNLVKTMPVIAGAAETRSRNKVEDTTAGKPKLTDEQKAVCRQLGQSEDAFLKSLEV